MARAIAPLVAVLIAASGCAERATHSDGTTICGTKFPTGAKNVVPTPLRNPGPSPATGPAPTTDELPSPPSDPAVADYSGATFVEAGGSCRQGAVVVVRPAANASLLDAVRAPDHGVAVLVLRLTGPVTVQAWRDGNFLGSVRLAG